jgi:hypothetical protein
MEENMNFKDYYLHAIHNNGSTFNGEKSLKVLESILKDGQLKSLRLRGITDEKNGGWNGLDYISLCDFECTTNVPRDNAAILSEYNAYKTYIINSISFIISKEGINAIKPIIVPPIIFDYNLMYEMTYLGNSKKSRYSDLFDEVHVKNQISLNHVIGMAIPIAYMINETPRSSIYMKKKEHRFFERKDLIEFLNQIKELLKTYSIPSNLYDIDTQMDINISENFDKAYDYAKKNNQIKKEQINNKL